MLNRMSSSKSFGQRLRDAREKLNLTQDQLGAGLGTDGKDCGKQTVMGWEKGKHFPRVDQLLLICQRVGLTPNDLLLDDKHSLTMKTLSGLEANLVVMFRMLNETQRDDALTCVNNLLTKTQSEPSIAAPFPSKKVRT